MNNLTTFALTLKLRRRSSMSALGQKQTFGPIRLMSALPPKADMIGHSADVRFVPILLQKSVEGFWGQ